MKTLSIVVPCFNEEEVLPQTAEKLSAALRKMATDGLISPESCIYFVDDGSYDNSWKIIESLHRSADVFCGIKLSCNRGHQNAILAGLLAVPGDMVVSIDADLQDDVNAIEAMVRQHEAGCDIVYGVRSDRRHDSFFKRLSADAFYKAMRWLGVDIIPSHADFRLMSRRAITALAEHGEVNLFVRGIVPQLGFKTGCVSYARAPRLAGQSKYPLRKMLALALNGVTSFSIRPLRFITLMGFAVSGVSVLLAFWGIAVKLFTDEALPGWASTVTPMYLLGGVQLLSLGIIGEYLGKIYLETKHRPRFIIEQALGKLKSTPDER